LSPGAGGSGNAVDIDDVGTLRQAACMRRIDAMPGVAATATNRIDVSASGYSPQKHLH
jgi:hypothetical protein